MWLLPLVTTFQWLGANFLTQNLFHEYNKVFKYFQKALIVICAKYVITFRISCLFSILREAEENLNYVFLVKESGSSFMIGCFTAGMCYSLGKIKKNHLILPKCVSFVVTNTTKSLKCGYYLWKLLSTKELWI